MQETNRGNKVKEKKSILRSTWAKAVPIVLLVFAGFLIRGKLDNVYEQMKEKEKQEAEEGPVGRELDYAENVSEDNKILQAFLAEYPGAEVLVACENDLTNDGLDDLVVIYRLEGHTWLLVTVDSGNSIDYGFTEAIPAPVENQKITFKNIDEKDEMEFVLQGQKGNKVGYGIYKVVDNAPMNLFGEGMEDC